MKFKKPLITTIICSILAIIASLIVCILMKWSFLSYRITTWIIGGLGIVNLMVIMFYESFLKGYRAKLFTLALHGTITALSVLMNYVSYYAGNYDSYRVIYILLLLGLYVIAIAVCITLNYVIKPKKPTLNPKNLPRK